MADPSQPSDALASSGTLSDTQPGDSSTQSQSPPPPPPLHTHAPSPDNAATSFDGTAERDLDAEIKPSSSSIDDANTTINASSQVPRPLTAQQQQQQQPPSAPETADSLHASVLPHIEPRIPPKKDSSLREFLGKMDDYTPLIPDAVTDYYLTLAGLPPPPSTDRRLARLLALATQKFIADIAADAYQYSRIRSTNTTSNNPLTGLGGAAGFGMNVGAQPTGGGGGGNGDAEGGGNKGGKKDAGKSQPLGGPRAGYGGGGAGSGQGRTVLTMEDLGMAVGEYGVNVKRGEFYR